MFVNSQPAAALAESRKYAVLPANLMRLFGEICGYHDLNDQIYQVLGEDATFRLNEVLSQSENLKKRLNKERLDTNDVNLMLKCQNVKPIEGHCSTDQIRSLLDEKADSIDLIEESANLMKNKKHHVRLRTLKLSCEFVDLKYRSDLIVSSDLPEELNRYYDFLIRNLFVSTNSELLERILKDLQSSDQLGDLVYHLINHLHQNLEILSKDQAHLMKLILILESLINNKHLEFKLHHSFTHLLDLSLDSLLDDRLKFDTEFLFKFRYCCAKLLRSILNKFSNLINGQTKILIRVLDLLLNRFIESSRLDIKYGIVIFFQHLNPFIFFDLLFPHLIEFVQQLESKLVRKVITSDEKQLFNSLLISLVSCFNYVINSKRILNSTEFDVNQYYLKIYEAYGDSFKNLIASNDFNFIKIITKKIDS